MPENFADRLLRAIADKKTPAVIAIDPVYSRLPAEIAEHKDLNDETDSEAALDAVLEYCRHVIHVVAPYVPAVKLNSAFFERYYSEGIEGYYELIQEATEAGLMVIGDVKRGDVGHSAEAYARAHLADSDFVNLPDQIAPDAVTVSGYFGSDGVQPFLALARSAGKGVFVLVRTSNESAGELQDVFASDGRRMYEVMGGLVANWATESGMMGARGYSAVGAVVSSKDAEAARRLRELMPYSLLLVPGYGAQGLTVEQCAPFFKSDGAGAIVAAGRSVIYAYEQTKYLEMYASEWKRCVEQACKDFVADLARVVRVG
ncbi:MAG: orotidine-5'-phosphate decarboxylase [Phycisphaerae bacterium]|nr:orotidine-5'-phosphate decarboxylase [Phycisphaerae bacterium]